MVRRALSARRYSENFTSLPLKTRLPRRSATVTHRVLPNKNAKDKDSSFWRPRAFWNDISDSDSDFGDGDFQSNNRGIDSNTKRMSIGPGALTRHIGSLRLKKRSRPVSFDGTGYDSNFNHSSKPRMGSILRRHDKSGFMVFPNFTGIHEAFDFKAMKARRDEARLEKQRVRLRKSIRPVIITREDAMMSY